MRALDVSGYQVYGHSKANSPGRTGRIPAFAGVVECAPTVEDVLFLAPMGAHNAIAVESWQVVEQWDLQRAADGMVTAVRYGVPQGDPEYSLPYADLKRRVATAAGSDAFAGKRIANTSGITQYHCDIGAYGDITPGDGETATFTPAQPPPPSPAPPTP